MSISSKRNNLLLHMSIRRKRDGRKLFPISPED
nr:MAG TPA: hypothetical protein [Caudoviricetes sp.]